MNIYLVRHSEAELLDTDPGLSERGKQQATELAKMLQTKNISIPFIYYSEKRRARETAEIIASFISPKPTLKEKTGINPNSDPAAIATELNHSKKTLMIVSHLPFLPTLVFELMAGHPCATSFEFGPASCVCLAQQNDHWTIGWTLN